MNQESLCSPKGVECYKNLKLFSTNCLKPCRGLFAEIYMDLPFLKLGELKQFEKLVEHYEKYKRGYSEDINYRSGLEGILVDLEIEPDCR